MRSAWIDNIQPKLKQIAGWARDGYTDKQICEVLGISQATMCKHKLIHPELVDALKVSKEMADLTVENSLFKRANGFTYVETCIKEKHDEKGKLMYRETTRNIRSKTPDTTAQIFWLRNRKPKQWRDVWKVQHDGAVDANVKINSKEFKGLLEQVMKDDEC